MAELNALPGLRGQIARTHFGLRSLAVWRAFWPLFATLGIYIAAAASGLLEQADPKLAAMMALTFWAALGVSGVRGLVRYRDPDVATARAALDAQSDLRPLQSLADRPTKPDPEAQALWYAHQERLSDAARRLRVPSFSEAWRQADPFRLRFFGALVLAVILALNLGQVPLRFSKALDPDYGSLFGAESIRIEAWITPPSHTGQAPRFLDSDTASLRVPSGSILTIRAQAPTAPRLRLRGETRRDVRFEVTPEGAFEVQQELQNSVILSVRWWGERARWAVDTEPDLPPSVSFVEMPVLGDGDRLEFSWSAKDDYGLEKLQLAIRPLESPGTEDRVDVDLGAVSPKAKEADSALDLTRERWAGARVQLALIVTDGAGQSAESEPFEMLLPEKLLLQPLAKAIQDVRVTVLREDLEYPDIESTQEPLENEAVFVSATQRIGHAPSRIKRAGLMLDGITYEGAAYYEDVMMYTGLRSAHQTLLTSSSIAEAKSTEPLLWALALRAEYGSAADALAALLAARAALEEALRDGASEEEIRRRMQAFKEAAQRYVAARMAEAMARGLPEGQDFTDSAQPQPGQSLGGQSFSDMLDALEDLTETGATDQARQLLADITNMLENLEFQQGQAGGEGFPGMPGQEGSEDAESVPQEEREITETMQELLDLLREQRELNDETLAQQRGERSGGAPNSGDGGSTNLPDWMQSDDLADRQGELGNRVEDLSDRRGTGQLGDDTGIDSRTLRAIERAQRRAQQALNGGNEALALRNQEQATEQLRGLAEQLAETLDDLRAARLGDNDQVEESADGSPFGAPNSGGADDSNSVDIPDEIERQRARDILDLLRQRYDETSDETEREYLERLLDRF